MLKNFALTSALAVMFAGAAVHAQTPATDQPADSTQRATTTQSEGTNTISGCLYRERDIPGRSPNVAERAGVLEDYILVTSGSSSSASGAAGAHKMFKLEHASDERLREFVGKRVEVTGKADAEAGDSTTSPATTPRADDSAGPDKVEIAEFEVASIRAASGGGECPATPGAKQ